MSRIEATNAARKKASTSRKPMAKPSPKKAKRSTANQQKAHSLSKSSRPLKAHAQLVVPSGMATANGAAAFVAGTKPIWEEAEGLFDAGQRAITDWSGPFLQSVGAVTRSGANVENQNDGASKRPDGSGDGKLESAKLQSPNKAQMKFNRYLNNTFGISDWTALTDDLGRLGFVKLSAKSGHIWSGAHYRRLSFSEKSINSALEGTARLPLRVDSDREGAWIDKYRELMERYPKMGSVSGFINKLVEEGHFEGLKYHRNDVIKFRSKPESRRVVSAPLT